MDGIARESAPKRLFKDHGFLIAGVALPVLVVLGFFAARTLPRLWVADPLFDALYLVRTGYDSQPKGIDRSIHVVDGSVRVRFTKLENPQYGQPMHVYRFRPASNAVDEIAIPDPGDPEALGAPKELPLAGLEGFRIDTSPRAPDGYEFENGSRGGSGLVNEIFIHRSRGPRSSIAKGGRVIVLPRSESEPYGYSPVEFLGWLVPAEGRR